MTSNIEVYNKIELTNNRIVQMLVNYCVKNDLPPEEVVESALFHYFDKPLKARRFLMEI